VFPIHPDFLNRHRKARLNSSGLATSSSSSGKQQQLQHQHQQPPSNGGGGGPGTGGGSAGKNNLQPDIMLEHQHQQHSSISFGNSGNSSTLRDLSTEMATVINSKVGGGGGGNSGSAGSGAHAAASSAPPPAVSSSSAPGIGLGSGSISFRSSVSHSMSNSDCSLWLEADDSEQYRDTSSSNQQDKSSASMVHSHSYASNASDVSGSDASAPSLVFNNRKTGNGPKMQTTFDLVGNYYYASPEMAGGCCIMNQAVDWWAVGVLLFHFLSGATPFESLTKASTLENIENMRCDWELLPRSTSDACISFLNAILTHGHATRLGSQSSEQIVGHLFFADIDVPTLYEGYGPFYPQPPSASDNDGVDFYGFSSFTVEDDAEIPDFLDSNGGGGAQWGQYQHQQSSRSGLLSSSLAEDNSMGSLPFSWGAAAGYSGASGFSLSGLDSASAGGGGGGGGGGVRGPFVEQGDFNDDLFADFNYHPI
jgi:hypothetical protein